MAEPISPDVGVTKRVISPQAKQYAGMAVLMVKTQPGVYYDDQGNIVRPDVARLAGFDVETLGLRRKVADRQRHAAAEIERQAILEQQRMEIENNPPFKSLNRGNGKYDVVNLDGASINEEILTKQQAHTMASKLNQEQLDGLLGPPADEEFDERTDDEREEDGDAE